MNLTSAQLSTLKTDIAANTATIPAGQPWTGAFAGVQVKDVPAGGDGDAAVAGWYSLTASPDYFVWRSDVPPEEIVDQLTAANYDPTDAPDETLIYNNRAFVVQIKQTTLQLLLLGLPFFNAARKNLRSALNNSTTNLPTGASGANRSGGWTNILPILMRKALRVEKLFALDDGAGIGNNQGDPRGASTNPDVMGYEGAITGSDVLAARNAA